MKPLVFSYCAPRAKLSLGSQWHRESEPGALEGSLALGGGSESGSGWRLALEATDPEPELPIASVPTDAIAVATAAVTTMPGTDSATPVMNTATGPGLTPRRQSTQASGIPAIASRVSDSAHPKGALTRRSDGAEQLQSAPSPRTRGRRRGAVDALTLRRSLPGGRRGGERNQCDDVAPGCAFALHVARRVVRGRNRLAAWRVGPLVLALAASACSAAANVPDRVDASDGCAAYYEPLGDDASVLFDPCSPRPTKPPRDGGR